MRNTYWSKTSPQLPGPLLVVCQDDIVEVSLENRMTDSTRSNRDETELYTSIHFHGIRHVGIRDKVGDSFSINMMTIMVTMLMMTMTITMTMTMTIMMVMMMMHDDLSQKISDLSFGSTDNSGHLFF